MTDADIAIYIGICIGAFATGYGVGLKIRAFKDFLNSV